ncbi:ferredoxin-NADP reductase [Streptomyces calvus]
MASLGLSALLASRPVPDLTARDVYVCGLPGMTTAVLRTVREPGVRKRQIHRERFSLAG